MSADEFWNGDPILAIDYRKADRLIRKRQNQMLWLQGGYVYDALCEVSPIYHTFAKKGTKPTPYNEEPYPIDKRDEKEIEKQKIAEKQAEIKRKMETFASQFNKRFEK